MKYLYLLIFLSSCREKSKTEIFFEKIAINIDKNHIKSFKSIPRDSLAMCYFTVLDNRAFYLSKHPSFSAEAQSILKKGGVQEVSDFWCDCFFAGLFHDHLNHIDSNRDTILTRCFRAYEISRDSEMIYNLEYVMKNNWIALANYNSQFVGDTIRVTLPVQIKDSLSHMSYQQNGLDSLTVTGQIVQKKIRSVLTMDYIYYPAEFDIKVIKIRYAKDDKISGQSIHLNDTITIDLWTYAKIINSGILEKANTSK